VISVRSATPVVQLGSVTVRYATGDRSAVSHVSFSVHAGEIVGLLGPSGAGKSTILNVIAGIVAPTEGTVQVLGSDPAELGSKALRELRSRVAMVHQQLALVPSLRVVHNVNAARLGSWSRHKACASLLRPRELAEVHQILETLGIADKLHARTSSLSGGQQQRVALARVLHQRADLLLADEPVSAVDPGWANEVLALLTAEVRERGCPAVVSLHDPELAKRWCTRLIGFREGVIVFDSVPSDVTGTNLAELYGIESTATLRLTNS
jgi:phosphonate transport system ATP-binding protein